jgi:hypothetical protein
LWRPHRKHPGQPFLRDVAIPGCCIRARSMPRCISMTVTTVVAMSDQPTHSIQRTMARCGFFFLNVLKTLGSRIQVTPIDPPARAQ